MPGVTSTTIYLGAEYSLDQGTANAATFGAGGYDSGDARNYYTVVKNDINAHGGIAGRKIEFVYKEFKTTGDIPTQYEAACETWTHQSPHGVFAILDSGRPEARECALKAGVAQFGENSSSVPETFRHYPNYVEISGMNLVREGSVTVDGLARQGYFEAGTTIGIVTWDDPNHKTAVTSGFIPALRAHGLSLAAQPTYVHVPQSEQDLGQTSIDVSGAVLNYNSKNINHVLILDGVAGVCLGGCLTTLFLREADGQQYYPRYGFNDDNQPQTCSEPAAGAGSPPLCPKRQLQRSLAVLWADIDDAADAGIAKNPSRERCYALMKKAGLPLDNVNAQATSLAVCGELWFMQAAAARMPGPITVANFMAGVNRLGPSLNDPLVYGTNFGPAQHDGVAAARNARFDGSCTCYVYTTAPYRV